MNSRGLRERYGSLGVVAGAGVGIGAAYARLLAREGLNLVLVSLPTEPLDDLAVELRRRHDVTVEIVHGDVTEEATLEVMGMAIAGRPVGVLVCNAALSRIGAFVEQDEEVLVAQIRINAEAPVRMIRRTLPRMLNAGRGAIVLMSSMSALQGTPLIATYAATKAFNLELGLSLWGELGQHGIDVLTCIPGAVDTPGFRASAPRGGAKPMSATAVASAALDALGTTPTVVPGRLNKGVSAVFSNLMSRRRATKVMGQLTSKMYGGKPSSIS